MKCINKMLILVLLFAGFAQAAKLGGTVRGTVLAISEIPPLTGLIQTWVEITVRIEDRSAPIKLLILNMEEHQKLPEVGMACTFDVHFEDVNGAVGQQVQAIKNAKIADKFECFSERR